MEIVGCMVRVVWHLDENFPLETFEKLGHEPGRFMRQMDTIC